MVFFCGNDAILGKEAKVRQGKSQLRAGPKGTEGRREENQPPLFMKEENMGTGNLRQPVQNLLGRDHRGEEGPGKGAGIKEHAKTFVE
jgi:hypothetical protein